MSTLLAPNFTIAEWYALRDKLVPEHYDSRWKRVVTAIRRRLTRRFVEPADALVRRERRNRRIPEGPGFAVLALDCLLLETLFGYERGGKATKTGRSFTRFLRTAPGFKESFAKEDRAKSFAGSIRNGLLHDGETRHGWIVWKGRAGGPLVYGHPDGRLVLYRDAFHAAVSAYLGAYLAKLREPGEVELRRKLKTRIDRLCKDSAPAHGPMTGVADEPGSATRYL